MNKMMMGCFLKEQRNKKKLTMKEVIDILNAENLGVTTKTVSDWEAGKSIPELEKLTVLSKIYNVSLDEILNGQKVYTKADFIKSYPIFGDDFDKMNIDKQQEWFDLRTKYVKKINNRFKELMIKFYTTSLTKNEDIELGFLFNGKCCLSEYFLDKFEKRSKDDYVNIRDVMVSLKKDGSITNETEFYWEIQKYFDVKCPPYSSVVFNTIYNEEYVNNSFVQALIDQSESWELDMLIAGLQNFDPVDDYIDKHSNHLNRYKERHGKEFNRETIFKNALKYLVSKGGVLNPYFLNAYQKRIKTIKIIDKLEDLYVLAKRPLEVFVYDEKEQDKRFLVDTTPFNRFLVDYYSYKSALAYHVSDDSISPREVFDLVINDKGEKRAIDVICKNRNIDTNRDEKLVLADINFDLNQWRSLKTKYQENENKIVMASKEIERLEKLLELGKETYEEKYVVEIGPKEEGELLSYVKLWKSKLSFQEFKKQRRKDLTKKLMEEIDILSVAEIRSKYFKKETFEEEEHD